MIDLPFNSIAEMMEKNSEDFANNPAISYKKNDKLITLSYSQFYERILMVSRGLIKSGIDKGDRVAILSENRAGWVIADMGILSIGAVTVPIYATNTPDQVEYVLNHSGAKIIFVSTKLQYEKLLKIKDRIPELQMVVATEKFLGDPSLPVHTLFQLSEISHPLNDQERVDLKKRVSEVKPEDMATVVYTSGTTGIPKGVMLTHSNFLYDAFYSTKKVGYITNNEVALSFLPLSHVLERTAGYYLVMINACHMVFAESIEKVPENMLEIQPTMMVSVPRLFEKIHSRIYETVHHMSPFKRKLFHKAIQIGNEYVDKKYIKREPLGLTDLKYKFFDKLVFKKLRAKFGGKVKWFVSGGAPLDKHINEFFWSIGLPILEGYGLTETSPVVVVNSLEKVRFGSIGTALDHIQLKLASDGELLIKGPALMKGYYKDDEATKKIITEDGFLMSGDIAEIDDEGYIYIVDRKKEIIVTAGGKNIAPQPLENELKLDKYISQAFVHGDRKPYLVAIIAPNFERLVEYAREHHIDYVEMDDLVSHSKIQMLLESRLMEINKNLPSYETIKKVSLISRDFTIAGGELTPTLKLKRKPIYEKYKEKIEKMYL